MYDPATDYLRQLASTARNSDDPDERDRALNTATIMVEYWNAKDKKRRERMAELVAERHDFEKEFQSLVTALICVMAAIPFGTFVAILCCI